MANVVRDPREHPEAILPDFAKPDPLLSFTKEDIAFVYEAEPPFRLVARNALDGEFLASPCVAGDDLILRSNRFLYCLRAPAPATAAAGRGQAPAGE